MANKRNKKKMNLKWANRISLAISIIYFICVLVNGMILKPTGGYAMAYWGVGCIVGTLNIYFVCYFFIFKRKDEERAAVTMQFLSYTNFKQVYFLAKGYDSMMRQILQKEGCKFYAKLTENKNIYLIVKDKHNEEVYSKEIENHVDFNSNFKFEE